MWDVIHEMTSYADAIIASLAKNFCVDKGGLIATNDAKLYDKIQSFIQKESLGIDVIDKKLIALSLQNRSKILGSVRNRVHSVQTIWKFLEQHEIPVITNAAGHCILIDVKQIPEFQSFEYPVASFISWLFLTTGIRSGAHNVGMQKGSEINNLVRLAIPVGLSQEEVKIIADKLVKAFKEKINISEIIPEDKQSGKFGNIYANFKLKKYHNTSGKVVSEIVKSKTSSEDTLITEQLEQQGLDVDIKKIEIDENAEEYKSTHVKDIAIVGIAGRYPKARNMVEFWSNLVQGKDCIEAIPDARLEQRLQNKFSKKYRGGFIDDIDKFD